MIDPAQRTDIEIILRQAEKGVVVSEAQGLPEVAPAGWGYVMQPNPLINRIPNFPRLYSTLDDALREAYLADLDAHLYGDKLFACHLEERNLFIQDAEGNITTELETCLLYTSPSPRD